MSSNLSARPEWQALAAHRKALEGVHMRDLFASDLRRFDKFSARLPGFTYDFSKNKITEETIALLCDLARSCNIEGARQALYSGAEINTTEKRAALHMALRGSQPEGLKINGEDVAEFVKRTLAQIKKISERVRSERSITDVIHIGIGGSDLGPRMVCRALCEHADGPNIHFLANIDGQSFAELARTLKPKNTLIIVVSKTFTTMETLTNARTAKEWMAEGLSAKKLKRRIIGVTMNERAALDFGIEPENILPLRDWIGGRFSLWGAVGLPIAISVGYNQFEVMLAGARAADEHFMRAPLESNIPVLMALIGVWYRNFWDYRAQAILPYAHTLEHFKSYIQQMDMESNGKGTRIDGHPTNVATGPVLFGEVGTDAQHAFMQLLHQSAEIIPADLIVIARPEHTLRDHHIKLVSHALAQSKALMEGNPNPQKPHSHFEGNRPSSTFILDQLDAWHLGVLLALYEHKIFVQGVIWGINSFDQWGVELGKTIAQTIIDGFDNDQFMRTLDPSSAGLLKILRQKFTNS